MKTFQIIGVLIAATGLVTVLVAKGSQTANIVTAGFNGLGNWTKKSQGRG